MSDVDACSFFPTKNLGAYGDGGLITTNDDQVAECARMLRVHGGKKKYHNEMFGYNSCLDALQAAILKVKLSYIDQWNENRRQVASYYNESLSQVEGVIVPELNKGHVFHQYTIRVLQGKRDRLKESLAEAGIGSMIYYPIPQDQLPVYQGRYESFANSNLLAEQVLSLPIWPELSMVKLQLISEKINKSLT